ncbi:MAG: glycine/betaine ABC transporter ATP-binding protein [Bacillaceae bacterium G1]|nr:MAG: glycine/betaine ABC transporter ATP-binding protein [Bacillaceae bacterium G1]
MTEVQEPIIRVRRLTKVFGPHPEKALDMLRQGKDKAEILKKLGTTVGVCQAEFDIYPGEIFVIMGLSGSGKSTLLRCLNRLIEPTEGEIWIGGQNITKLDEKAMRQLRQKRISMVFQQFALFPHRTVLDNVAYGLEVQGVPRKERHERARQSLSLVGLAGWEDKLPGQLSGGMQQRVGLARALCTDPDILLMDEAFSALDPLIREEMQDELLNLQSNMQKTIVFITHDLNEALKLGDRIALMLNGRIVQIGTPEEIIGQPANDYVARFVRGVDKTKVLTAQDVMKKPEPVITPKDGPRVALKQMRSSGISSIFVVERNRRLLGLLTADAAFEATEKGERDILSRLSQDFDRVHPDQPVEDILPVVANAKAPLAVIDEQERLLGVIVRGSVLEALASGGGGKHGNGPTAAGDVG